MRYALSILTGLLLVGCAAEQVPEPPTWSDVVTGEPIDPLHVPKGGAAVLIFITTDCPIANGYSPQLHAMAQTWSGKPVNFTLVHVDAELSDSEARKHAEEYGHTCQIVVDRDHRLVRLAGATVTPEAAVFSAPAKLEYLGRINNWYGDLGRKRPQISKHELRDAVTAVLTHIPVPVTRAEAIGCTIEPLHK